MIQNKLKGHKPNSARLHSCGDGHGFVDVIGEDSSSQAILCVVGSFDDFFNRLKLHNLLNWPKDLPQSRESPISKQASDAQLELLIMRMDCVFSNEEQSVRKMENMFRLLSKTQLSIDA